MGDHHIPTVSEFESMELALRKEFVEKHGVLIDQKVEWGRKHWKHYFLFGMMVEVEFDLREKKVWDVVVFKPYIMGGKPRTDKQ